MPDDPDIETPKPPKPPSEESREEHGPSALVMLAVTVLLVVGGYFLAVKLKEMGRLQDCVMSGRTNCAPVAPPAR
ncbi:MAG TPA: hypothetical protein VN809_08105 [Telmatospirillum sp.]|nr:hypothetical protein [Telmatospirillum sp.]